MLSAPSFLSFSLTIQPSATKLPILRLSTLSTDIYLSTMNINIATNYHQKANSVRSVSRVSLLFWMIQRVSSRQNLQNRIFPFPAILLVVLIKFCTSMLVTLLLFPETNYLVSRLLSEI